MKKKPKVCLIGAGRIGFKLEEDNKRIKPATHFGMWLSNKNIKFVGIAEKDKINQKFKKKIPKNIKIFKDYIEMLRVISPDIVSIATWKDTHYKITDKCIDYGVKVIVLEKPLANDISEAKNIFEKIKKNKTQVLVNHRRRFDAEIIKLKDKISNGLVGKVLQVSSYYVYGCLTTATHLIDTLRMLLCPVAGEVDSVIGVKNKFNNFKPNNDQNVDGLLIFSNGLNCSIQSLDMKSYDNFDIVIYGTKGKIFITDIARSGYFYKVIKSTEHTGFHELSSNPKKLFGPRPRKQFSKLAENAVACLRSHKEKPLCGPKDSLLDMMIIDRLFESAKKNSVSLSLKKI
jgi:predicted dehydrogenase